jgi:transcriptional regulator with XRE-family HTH domain
VNAIAKFRESKGLTQEQVAKLLGTTKATVSRWETETRRPDPAMAIEIEGKLGIPRQALRPDLFSVRAKPARSKVGIADSRRKKTGKSNWEMAYGSMKGLIKSPAPAASPYSEREWEKIEKDWLANWDELLKR